MAWDLDIVHDMIHASKISYVDTDLCAWGAKDAISGEFIDIQCGLLARSTLIL